MKKSTRSFGVKARAILAGSLVLGVGAAATLASWNDSEFAIGAITGGLIMGVLNNGMSLLGIGTDYQQYIKGLVLLLAVAFDVFNKRRTSRVRK